VRRRCPGDPPRCCACLQRFTRRRSQSVGFPAPPPSFDLSTWTLTSSAGARRGWLPSRALIPLMALHAPSRTPSVSRPDVHGVGARPPLPGHPVPPMGFACPFSAPSPRNPLPGDPSPTRLAVPVPDPLVAGFHTRFGPPPPFSTTLTVCSSSNPVTCFGHSRSWGSCVPFSPFRGPSGPGANTSSVRHPGGGGPARSSRSVPPPSASSVGSRSTCVARFRPAPAARSGPPLRPPKRPVRFRLPPPCACGLQSGSRGCMHLRS
jgi:hypothetical protein